MFKQKAVSDSLLGPSLKIHRENKKSFYELPMGKILEQLHKEGALSPMFRRILKICSPGDSNDPTGTVDTQTKYFSHLVLGLIFNSKWL